MIRKKWIATLLLASCITLTPGLAYAGGRGHGGEGHGHGGHGGGFSGAGAGSAQDGQGSNSAAQDALTSITTAVTNEEQIYQSSLSGQSSVTGAVYGTGSTLVSTSTLGSIQSDLQSLLTQLGSATDPSQALQIIDQMRQDVSTLGTDVKQTSATERAANAGENAVQEAKTRYETLLSALQSGDSSTTTNVPRFALRRLQQAADHYIHTMQVVMDRLSGSTQDGNNADS